MLPKVLNAFQDAWLLSEAGEEMPPAQIHGRFQNLATDGRFTRLRTLLFGSFGINLRSNGELATDSYSEGAYVTVMSN